MFEINTELLNNAKNILSGHKNIYWIIGGACSGKSTIGKTDILPAKHGFHQKTLWIGFYLYPEKILIS